MQHDSPTRSAWPRSPLALGSRIRPLLAVALAVGAAGGCALPQTYPESGYHPDDGPLPAQAAAAPVAETEIVQAQYGPPTVGPMPVLTLGAPEAPAGDEFVVGSVADATFLPGSAVATCASPVADFGTPVVTRRRGLLDRLHSPATSQFRAKGTHKERKAEIRSLQGKGLSTKVQPFRDNGYNNPCFPRELRMASHPPYVVEPSDVLYIEAYQVLPGKTLAGERLIAQDGTISLGYYGAIHVAGLTIPEIEEKIRMQMREYVRDPQVFVDVSGYNTKWYYVAGQVQQIGRLPITGKETVLDALMLSGDITTFADKDKIHVARPNPGGGCDQILWVDYDKIVYCGDTRTNYQLLPGDRVVVPPSIGYKVNVAFDNFLSPVERVAGIFSLVRIATDSGR